MSHRPVSPTTRIPNPALFREVAGWLSAQQSVTLKVMGSSMWPFLTGGRDEVVIAPLTPRQPLSCGEIVLARLSDESYVLHRIIRIDDRHLTLMGDGHWRQREHCSPADIIGRVITIRRNGHTIDCTGRAERFRVQLWMQLLPLRRYLLFVCHPLRHTRRLLQRRRAAQSPTL